MRITYSQLVLLAALLLPVAAFAADEPPVAPAPVSAPFPDMPAMEKLLADYQLIVQNGGWPALVTNDKKITPGSTDPRIATIREILMVTGDDTGGTVAHPAHYDDALLKAVKNFQDRNGLADDGVIGKTTLAALAVPVEKRIAQIQATMQRMQALPIGQDARFIVVNLPEFRLHGFENGEPVIDMKVVVGAAKTRTPTFANEITYVTFNPQWRVPAKIARNELLPKIIKDRAYLQDHDYAIYNADKEETDPETVDWDAVNGGTFPYQIRQRAGKKNALGKIKFGMIDSDDIYLHDTSAPSFFAKDDRALSHGCIRVEHPYELAQFIFKDSDKFPPDKVDALYEADATKTVHVPAVPVYLVYWTAWVDATGRANFRKDIYDMDKL